MKTPPRSQKGAALLLAMVILTLVATLAAGMIWQQWRAIQVESAERSRAQAAWILTGAIDLGRVVLRLDARTAGADHLDEPWATQLQEASLSSLLAQDRNNTVDNAPEAFLLGSIRDAQSRYNLRNLVDASHKLVEAEVAALTRLCASAAVAPETAQAIANGLLAAWRPDNDAGGEATDAPLAPSNVEQLVWLGLDAQTVRRLQPFVELLPEATPLNINTASGEVLAGVLPGLDAGSAARIVQRRPFKTMEEARTYIPGTTPIDPKRIDVASRYFEISGRLRMEGRVLEESLLVQRRNREIVPIRRTRQSLQPGAS
ncbi:MAG: type II secretion system minor pseudopilin GspK [Rubrivivax sp.]